MRKGETNLNLKAFSQRMNELLAVKTPMIWVTTREEKIAEKAAVKEVMRTNSASHFYFCDNNGGALMDPLSLLPSTAQNAARDVEDMFSDGEADAYPDTVPSLGAALAILSKAPEATCLVIRNAEDVFRVPNAQRAIFNICMRDNHKEGVYNPIIMVTTEKEVPQMLVDFTVSVDLKLMDEMENLMLIAPWAKKHGVPMTKNDAFKAARCATGLTTTQVMQALEDGLHRTGKVDIKTINDVRVQAIEQSHVLQYIEPKKTLDTVGGHDLLKEWIREEERCMTPDAAKKHVKRSKGFIAMGQAGTGKTAIAEAIANELGVPFIIFDLSKIMGGIVGQSESQARHAFDLIESLGACVVLLDEVDKQLAGVGSNSPVVADGGTIQRVFDIILREMNDNSKQFYIMTANDVSKLPPELMRRGRIDRKWFFTFPTEAERKEIFNIYFKKAKMDVPEDVVDYAARMADHFTGAEVEGAVDNMVRLSFIQNQPVSKALARKGIRQVTSIWESNRAKVDELLQYAQENNIPMTSSSDSKPAEEMDEESKRRYDAMEEAMENFSKGA